MEKEKINELEMKLITASTKVMKNYSDFFNPKVGPELIISYKYSNHEKAKLNIKVVLEQGLVVKNNPDKKEQYVFAEFYLNDNGTLQFINENFTNLKFAEGISSQYLKELEQH
jgi:hypothetical protein